MRTNIRGAALGMSLCALSWLQEAHGVPINVAKYWPMASNNWWTYDCKSKVGSDVATVFSTVSNQGMILNQTAGACLTVTQYFFLDAGTTIQLPKSIDDVSTDAFSPSIAFLPKTAEPGQAFNSSGTLTYIPSEGDTQTLPYTASVVVLGIESITVPAGTFKALHVQQTLKVGALFDNVDDVWLGDGVGEVRRVQSTGTSDGEPTDLRLIASNLVPNATKDDGDDSDCSKYCGDPINYANGNSYQTELDFDTGGALQFRRFYNSRAPLLGPLGYGWRHQYEQYLIPHFQTSPRRVSVKRADGKWFNFTENSSSAWTTDGDVNYSLSPVYDNGTNSPPTSWIVRTPANELETYAADGSFTSVSSMAGLRRDIQSHGRIVDQVVDVFGRTLSFSYRDDGQLTSVNWGNGQSQIFDYDNALNLSAITFADQTTHSYRYNEAGRVDASTPLHALTSTLDESNVEDRYWTFDSLGRATSSQRAGGVEKVSIQYGDLGAATITDALNTVRQVTYAFISGKSHPLTFPSKSNQAILGSDALRTYDANGNVSSRNDFNGARTCLASDLVRNLESVRVEGLGAAAACASYVPAGASLPTGVRKISTQWHPSWRVPVAMALPRRLVYDVYNGQSDPVGGGTAACAPVTAKLSDGKPIAVLCKRYELATTDANGALGFSATVDSSVPKRVRQWTYNQYGQVLTAQDPLNNTTTNVYYPDTTVDHTLGDLWKVTNALNQSIQLTKYNPAGQWLTMVDANGATTTRTFDLRQRLKSTTTGTLTTSYDYWPTGLLKTVTLPDASTVNYGYDDAHRLTSVTDNLGNKIVYTLDNSGNRTGENVTDPSSKLAKTLTRVPDALNRIQQVSGRE